MSALESANARESTEPGLGPCLAARTVAATKVTATLTGLRLVRLNASPRPRPSPGTPSWGELYCLRDVQSQPPLSVDLLPDMSALPSDLLPGGLPDPPSGLSGLCLRHGAFSPVLLNSESPSPRRGVELATLLALAVGTWVEGTACQFSAWDGGLNLPGRAQRLQWNHTPERRPVRNDCFSLCAPEILWLVV